MAAPPYHFRFDGPSANNYRNLIEGVDDQVIVLAAREAVTSEGALAWARAWAGTNSSPSRSSCCTSRTSVA